MNCPRCRTALTTRVVDDVEIDECDACRGMWLDDDELRRAKDLSDPNLVWMDFEIWKHQDRFRIREVDLPCPRCETSLRALEYGDTDVEIDVCPKCRGTWLDGLELQRIVSALQAELASTSSLELLRRTLEEALELVRRKESLASEWKDLTQLLRLVRQRRWIERRS